jgi:hypothetical protein
MVVLIAGQGFLAMLTVALLIVAIVAVLYVVVRLGVAWLVPRAARAIELIGLRPAIHSHVSGGK